MAAELKLPPPLPRTGSGSPGSPGRRAARHARAADDAPSPVGTISGFASSPTGRAAASQARSEGTPPRGPRRAAAVTVTVPPVSIEMDALTSAPARLQSSAAESVAAAAPAPEPAAASPSGGRARPQLQRKLSRRFDSLDGTGHSYDEHHTGSPSLQRSSISVDGNGNPSLIESPSITLSRRSQKEARRLFVAVERAGSNGHEDLTAMDRRGQSDPYIKVFHQEAAPPPQPEPHIAGEYAPRFCSKNRPPLPEPEDPVHVSTHAICRCLRCLHFSKRLLVISGESDRAVSRRRGAFI